MLLIIGLALLLLATFGILSLRKAVNQPEPPGALRSELIVEMLLLGCMSLSIVAICVILKQFL